MIEVNDVFQTNKLQPDYRMLRISHTILSCSKWLMERANQIYIHNNS